MYSHSKKTAPEAIDVTLPTMFLRAQRSIPQGCEIEQDHGYITPLRALCMLIYLNLAYVAANQGKYFTILTHHPETRRICFVCLCFFLSMAFFSP